MLKYFFAFIVLFHGLIHFMGFAKAFGYGNITQLTKAISKPAGISWFLTAALFIIAVVLFLLKTDEWATIAIIAVLISQILIITDWKDAKFGTIANGIILLVAIPAIANVQFNKMARKEVASLLSTPVTQKTIIIKEMLDSLPPIVRKWAINSGIIGKEKVHFVRLKQKGEMLTKPGGRWMPFTATQYFNVDEPGFHWKADVKMMPLVSLNARDKFFHGNGEMLIKLWSLVNVAKAGGDQKMNESTMLRWLAETCWFPSAALNKYIAWKPIDAVSAEATMTYDGLAVSGVMRFNEKGDLLSFSAMRYYGNGLDATREKWFIEITGYQYFQGVRIPAKFKVTWKLKGSDFYWLNLELTSLEFNKPEIYK